MILSVHFYKTAGMSFKTDIIKIYGDHVCLFYHGGKLLDRDFQPLKEVPANTKIIHGHFARTPRIFERQFPDADYITILREPIQKVVSGWFHQYRLTKLPIDHPSHSKTSLKILNGEMSFKDYVELETNRNRYGGSFAQKPMDDYVLIGITERYIDYFNLFKKMFGIKQDIETSFANNNPTKKGKQYDIDQDTRDFIAKNNQEDIEIYNQAVELFEKQFNNEMKTKVAMQAGQQDITFSFQKPIESKSSPKQEDDFFKKNIEALSSTNPHVARWIEGVDDSALWPDYHVTDRQALYKNHVCLHDLNNPEGEAQSLAQKWLGQQSQDKPVCVMGFGLGFHIEALLKLMGPEQGLLVQLVNRIFFQLALRKKDLSHILADPRLKFVNYLTPATSFVLPGYTDTEQDKKKEQKKEINNNNQITNRPRATFPKIFVAGVSKSGTTGIYYKLINSMHPHTAGLFEPGSAQGFEKILQNPHGAVAKVVLPGLLKRDIFDKIGDFFDKTILIVRDPRDQTISRLLYEGAYHAMWERPYHEILGWISAIRMKEKNTQAFSVLELFKPISRTGPFNIDEFKNDLVNRFESPKTFLDRYPNSFTIHYEDFINGNLLELERFLDFKLEGEAKAHESLNRVVRTRGSGSWRDWFTLEDIAFFKEPFESYMTQFNYDVTDWHLSPNPQIIFEHASAYVIRVLNERRRAEGLKEISFDL